MFVKDLVLQKDISDVLENNCWSEGGTLYRENRIKTV